MFWGRVHRLADRAVVRFHLGVAITRRKGLGIERQIAFFIPGEKLIESHHLVLGLDKWFLKLRWFSATANAITELSQLWRLLPP